MKRILASMALAIATSTASAQASFGVHAGAGMHNVTQMQVYKTYGLETKCMVGYTAGAMLSYKTAQWLDLQAELNYSMRGYKDEMGVGNLDEIAEYAMRSSYLELPLLAKIYPIRNIGLNIQAGPQIGMLLCRNLVSDNDKLEALDPIKRNRKLDFGFAFGLGYDYRQWCIDLRYYLGLEKTYTDLDACKNRGVSVAIGYYL